MFLQRFSSISCAFIFVSNLLCSLSTLIFSVIFCCLMFVFIFVSFIFIYVTSLMQYISTLCKHSYFWYLHNIIWNIVMFSFYLILLHRICKNVTYSLTYEIILSAFYATSMYMMVWSSSILSNYYNMTSLHVSCTSCIFVKFFTVFIYFFAFLLDKLDEYLALY